MGLAILVGVPLGVLMTRFTWLAGPLQAPPRDATIPSIALFGLLMPVCSVFGQGLGRCRRSPRCSSIRCCRSCATPTSPLTGVEAGIREAGKGIGMTFWQRLRMVDIPLAVPVILAGVRTAVVMNIGVMTIAAVIGAGGLGVLILTSISQSNMPMLWSARYWSASLAIVADLLLQWLQRILTPKGLRASAH